MRKRIKWTAFTYSNVFVEKSCEANMQRPRWDAVNASRSDVGVLVKGDTCLPAEVMDDEI